MARGRMLSSSLGGSRKFSRLETNEARLIYCLLLPHTDAYGRIEADPDYVKGTALSRVPVTVEQVQTALENMHEAGLITLYVVDDFQYAEFTDFELHNRTYPSREAQTTIPAPDGNVPERPARDDQGTPSSRAAQDPGKTQARPRRENVSTKRKRNRNKELEDITPPTPPKASSVPNSSTTVEAEPRREREKPEPTKATKKKQVQHEFNPTRVLEELPPQFDHQLFLDFCAMRLKIKRPMTTEALRQFINKHKSRDKPVLDEMFRNAIVASWLDLYPPKTPSGRAEPVTSSALDQYTERGL